MRGAIAVSEGFCSLALAHCRMRTEKWAGLPEKFSKNRVWTEAQQAGWAVSLQAYRATRNLGRRMAQSVNHGGDIAHMATEGRLTSISSKLSTQFHT